MNETLQQAARRFTAKLVAEGFQKQALHIYRYAEEKMIYARIRLKHPETKEKWIRPITCDET